MLKDFERKKAEDKDALNAEIKEIREKLLAQQQLIRDNKLPVLVLIEGWAAAGKGTLIKELISEIDPRFYNVSSPAVVPESEARYPFLYPYATAIPENGKFMFLDSGWMESTVRKYLRHEITKEEYKRRVRSVNEFERQLRDGGYVVLKIFLHIDKDEQFDRLQDLVEWTDTEWRVTRRICGSIRNTSASWKPTTSSWKRRTPV
jgi:polyphosphate kinase 2 (PPK2 family)